MPWLGLQAKVKMMLDRWIAMPMRALIAVYRYGVSPFIAGSCRYHPSCSAYAEEALSAHGAARGSWLALKRMIRCHPWGGHGYDPVPEQVARMDDPERLGNSVGSSATSIALGSHFASTAAAADSRKGSR